MAEPDNRFFFYPLKKVNSIQDSKIFYLHGPYIQIIKTKTDWIVILCICMLLFLFFACLFCPVEYCPCCSVWCCIVMFWSRWCAKLWIKKKDKSRYITWSPLNYQGVTMNIIEVRRILLSLNARKSARPNGIPGQVLLACTNPNHSWDPHIFFSLWWNNMLVKYQYTASLRALLGFK